jgi:hypothetical protein
MRGSAGALLNGEAGSRAVGHMAVPEPSLVGSESYLEGGIGKT